jgi:hypothetical protein
MIPPSTRGNVTETLHDVHTDIDMLLKASAARGSIARQRQLFLLLDIIEQVDKMSVGKSGEWYLDAMNKIQDKLNEI